MHCTQPRSVSTTMESQSGDAGQQDTTVSPPEISSETEGEGEHIGVLVVAFTERVKHGGVKHDGAT